VEEGENAVARIGLPRGPAPAKKMARLLKTSGHEVCLRKSQSHRRGSSWVGRRRTARNAGWTEIRAGQGMSLTVCCSS